MEQRYALRRNLSRKEGLALMRLILNLIRESVCGIMLYGP